MAAFLMEAVHTLTQKKIIPTVKFVTTGKFEFTFEPHISGNMTISAALVAGSKTVKLNHTVIAKESPHYSEDNPDRWLIYDVVYGELSQAKTTLKIKAKAVQVGQKIKGILEIKDEWGNAYGREADLESFAGQWGALDRLPAGRWHALNWLFMAKVPQQASGTL